MIEVNDLGIGALVAFAMAWLIAHLIKTIVAVVKNKRLGKEELESFTKNGGMPSGHTATMAALATYLGILYGFGSGIFALAVAVLLVVAYDAMKVRRAVGEHGEILKRAEKKLKVVKGHTPLEVLAGAVLGIVVGQVVALIFGVV